MPETPLAVRGLDAFYSDFQALFGVSLEVARGEAVAHALDANDPQAVIRTPQAVEIYMGIEAEGIETDA
jgi:hypothetical protein